MPDCLITKELFTTFPVEEGKFSSITPLGNLNPSSHTFPTDHIYVEVADPQYPERNTIANAKLLIAPADMSILAIQMSEQIGTAGSKRSGMLDIWMSDYREPQVKRANSSRWSSDRNYVSCFLDSKNLFINFKRWAYLD